MFLATSTPKKTMPYSTNSYQEQSLIKVLPAEAMLSLARVQKQLQQIEQLVNIPAEYYQETYKSLLTRFAEYVQVLPSIEGGQLGGLFEEGLARALLAIQLQLAESKEEEPVFTFAVFSAALLIDLRKLYANKKIMISDPTGVFISEWSPFEGSLVDLATQYKIRTFYRPLMQLSPYLTLLLSKQVMPDAGFLWLEEDLKWLNMWLAALCGDEEGAGGVGHFLNLAKKKMSQLEKKPKLVVPVEMTNPREVELGEAFWSWLKKVAIEKEAIQPENSIHRVDEGIFLEVPKIFEDFCVQASIPDWRIPYQQFMKMGIAITNQEDNDLSNPDQLFIYLNKDEVVTEKKSPKTSEMKKVTRNFFADVVEKQLMAAAKEQEIVQASYRKQGLLIAEQWVSRTTRDKLRFAKLLKAFVEKQKFLKKFRALKRFQARRSAAKFRMSSRFHK